MKDAGFIGTDLGFRRNEQCICRSGARFKHCCGRPGGIGPDDPPTWPAGKSLLKLLMEADQAGLEAGEEPKARSLKNILRLARAVRPGGGTILAGEGTEPHITKAAQLMGQLYRRSDIGMGALHVGAIMFRDIFARVDIPIVYRILNLDPLEQSDLTLVQKRWLVSSTEEFRRFLDQFFDLVDFAFGWDDLQQRPSVMQEVKAYLTLAHMQLESAAATVTAQCDLRGAVQSSLLSVELALKAAILSDGVPEDTLKSDFGHDTKKMLKHLERHRLLEEPNRVAGVLDCLPRFVSNRYAATQPSRSETGHILMGAQYVGSEVARALSGRNVRKENSVTALRAYP
jgi:hypothetical protein